MTFALSLCRTLDDASTKEDLERNVHLDALHQQAADARRRLDDVFDLSALPPATLAFDELRRKLQSLVPRDAEVTPEWFARDVLGSILLFCRGLRERLATKDRLTASEVRQLRKLISNERELSEQIFGKDAVAWLALGFPVDNCGLCRILKIGTVPSFNHRWQVRSTFKS